MLKCLKTLAVFFTILCLSSQAQALKFSEINQIVFFGDSLTDSGFNDLLPLGPKAPTFTTLGGYIYSQYLANYIKGTPLPVYPGPVPPDTITNNQIYPYPTDPFVSGTKAGFDYAAGGSTTNGPGNGLQAPSLIEQVNFYLAHAPQTLDPRNVYFVFSGANDFLTLLNNPNTTELQFLQTANLASMNIGRAVASLAQRGARRFVVMSLPNIGFTPRIDALSSAFPTLPAMLKIVTFTFNSMLNTQLGVVIKNYGVKILYFDTFDLLDNVIIATKNGHTYYAGGEPFKFTNYNMAVCPESSALLCSSTSKGHIFADDIHPTGLAHRLLSLEIREAILAWK
jgi:outer membrane lipase/esterase